MYIIGLYNFYDAYAAYVNLKHTTMKYTIYPFVCLAVIALQLAGCSNSDGDEVAPGDTEVPPTIFSFAPGPSAPNSGFEVVGNPEINGDQYTFNATVDEDNGCGLPGGDHIKLDTLEAIWANGFSMYAWIEFTENRNFERVFDFGNGRGEDDGKNITLSRFRTTSGLALTSWVDSTAANRWEGRVIADDAIVNNQRTFYAATISTSGEMKLYVNGELAAQKEDGNPVANVRRTRNFIGHSNWCELDPDFKGTIEGLSIFDEVLSREQIRAVYEQNSN